jgi:ribosomal protein RSM22 (predicted rRNA methylase)
MQLNSLNDDMKFSKNILADESESMFMFSWKISQNSFDKIYSIVCKYIKDNELSDDDLLNYKRLIHEPSHIEYDVYASSFLYLYYVANYYKIRYCLEKSLQKEVLKKNFYVLDLGCGSGASTLALTDWYLHHNNSEVLRIDAIDNVEKQLNLHKEILSDDILNKCIQINRILDDGIQYMQQCNRQYDLVIAGNFLCELDQQKRKECINNLAKIVKPSALLLIVERLKSGVYEDFEDNDCFTEIQSEFSQGYEISRNERLVIPQLKIDSKNNFSIGYKLFERM